VSLYISNIKPISNDNLNSHISNNKNKNPKELMKKRTMKDLEFQNSSLNKEESISQRENSQNYNEKNQKNIENVVDFTKLKKIKVLSSGAYFGELALMEKKPRAATIKCDTECHLAVLEKDHFNEILSKILIPNNLI
jgi:CRP-like cAMP-binding protein